MEAQLRGTRKSGRDRGGNRNDDRGRGRGRSRRRCRAEDDNNQDRVLSKALSWVLRHGAPSIGLNISTDGYIPIAAILLSDTRGLKKFTEDDVRKVVASNDKQRFSLSERQIIISSDDRKKYSFVVSTDDSNNCASVKALCIRANQGHSIQGIVAEDLLTPIPSEELKNLDIIVHGTNKYAWEKYIYNEGLKRMNRNHIHFAPGLPQSNSHVISGMRKDCEIHIFVDGAKCAKDSVKFYRSTNGVILTPGIDNEGTLPVDYFSSIIDTKTDTELLSEK